MESYEDLYKTICRVCLSYGNKENMVCLTDKTCDDGLSCYGKAVGLFANIVIKFNDDLPKCMCQKCLKILKHAIYFKLKCESSDKQLSHLHKIHKQNGSNLKVSLVDFLMFNQYFPQKSSNKATSNISKSNSENSPKEISSEMAIDCDNTILHNDFTDNTIEDIDKDSSDGELEVIEKMINQSPKSSSKNNHNMNADEELNILEKMVAHSYAGMSILPKNNYKNSKKLNIINRKKSQQERKLSLSQRKLQHQKLQIRHTGLAKKPPEKFICKICQKELANQHTYRYHMERHNGCKFICEHCGKGFPVLVELHMHQVSRHGTGPFLQCPHCTYKAPRKLNLIEHIRIHTGERPYTCDKCGLTFRRSAIWKKHMVYHTEKTVQCPHCPRKFYRRSEMQAHANSIHERMYVYLCHKCDATYAKSATVRRHLTERHGVPRELQGKITRVNKGEVYGIL